MTDKNTIKNLAKETITLFDTAKRTKDFSSVFCRNFTKRVNEHVNLSDTVIHNINVINKYGNSLFEKLDKSITNKTLKALVNEQLVIELKRRENISLIKEQVVFLNELFTSIKALNILSSKEARVLETILKRCDSLSKIDVKENNTNIEQQFNKTKKIIKEVLHYVSKRIKSHLSETITEISDIGDVAAESVKSSDKNTLAWWTNALKLKQDEFNLPKTLMFELQKVISTTTNDIVKLRERIENARL